ncbi:gephyrin-like molybdotransferase Glp [Zavarzinia sp.]|uniref:molybdopterin molybdotransferase MoeA n=1 Tax=Zavarzinia sp. TaxID=2027920 RepID=UPI003BB690E1
MIPVDEARARILAALSPLPTETVSLSGAHGRVLAAPVTARRTQPPVPISAMDGWAVRAADVAGIPVALDIIGEAPAGQGFHGRVDVGQAVRIFTGAPIPDGANAVVIQENSSVCDRRVTLTAKTWPGQFIRPLGLDFSAGEELLPAGRTLGFRDIALLAAADVAELSVVRRPRVAVLATGDELVPPGAHRGAAQIVDAARPAVIAFIRERGGIALDLGIARDREDDILEKASGALDADLLVTLGGASVGDHDLVARVLAGGGADLDFWKIAMRPGKPLMFGRFGVTPLLGLPGNPVSALVCALLFLGPAIDRLSGRPPREAVTVPMRLATAIGANDRRQDYIRATVEPATDGFPLARPAPVQDSSQLRAFAGAQALIVRPPLAPAVDAGGIVDALLLDL